MFFEAAVVVEVVLVVGLLRLFGMDVLSGLAPQTLRKKCRVVHFLSGGFNSLSFYEREEVGW